MAVEGPERSGSGTGVPVPSSTTLVRFAGAFDGWLGGSWGEAANGISSRVKKHISRVIFIASSALREAYHPRDHHSKMTGGARHLKSDRRSITAHPDVETGAVP